MALRFDDEPTHPMRGLQIWQILIGAAHNRQTLTYGGLADILGFKGAGTLAHMLGHVAFFCNEERLPSLTALVVNRATGLPGEGIPIERLDAAREKVFCFDWYRVVPPSPKALAEAFNRGRKASAARAK